MVEQGGGKMNPGWADPHGRSKSLGQEASEERKNAGSGGKEFGVIWGAWGRTLEVLESIS